MNDETLHQLAINLCCAETAGNVEVPDIQFIYSAWVPHLDNTERASYPDGVDPRDFLATQQRFGQLVYHFWLSVCTCEVSWRIVAQTR
jgi:hypothetical protein